MATNYTVVLFSRQHIGNDPGVFNDVEPNVVFVGRAKDFPFDCPGVNSAEAAFLMFQSRDVDHQRNVLRVNGVDVFGGLPASPARDAWNGNILLVERHHQLKATGNVLRVEARTSDGGSAGDVDDFILDNVVIMYKTLDIVSQLPTATGDLAAFLTSGLLASIANVRGSGSGAEAADQRNEYVLPTPAQLVAWRAVFRSLHRRGVGSRARTSQDDQFDLQRGAVLRHALGPHPLHPHGGRAGSDPGAEGSFVGACRLPTLPIRRAEAGARTSSTRSRSAH